jgi:serine/threonine-protein kinase
LDQNPPRLLGPLIQIFIDTSKALESMHQHNLVHCDLKPNNILVSATGQVKVIDLGQACTVGTEKKRIQGTPDYIAPEQVKCRPISIRTDIYNLGATLYWALTGRNVPTLYTVKRQHKNSFLVDDQIPAPSTVKPMVPETLSNFVMECVRSDPRKRPADMNEVVRRLEIIQHVITRDRQSGISVA